MEDKILTIAGVIDESIVDGPGIRFVIFTQGCPHHCPGCQNPQTHPFVGGQEIYISALMKQILRDPLISGVTFSGGEPFCQAGALAALAQQLKQHGKHIMVYTGYTWEQLWEKHDADIEALLAQCDVLVDGRYEEKERDLTLRFRGSRNQRLIDVPMSRKAGRVMLTTCEYLTEVVI